MKLELRENMYIRTKDGHIDKILLVEYAKEKKLQYPNHPSKKYWRDKILLLKAGYWRTAQNIIKASYNIIDILEVGDFVNGQKIVDIGCLTNGPRKGTKVIDYYITPNTVSYLENEDIKSIVTHERMKQMELLVRK